MATATSNDNLPTTVDELQKILERARKGDEKTLPFLQKLLQNPANVELYGGNLAVQTENTLIRAAAGKNLLFEEALLRKLELLRKDLSGPTPTPIESLLVERIVTCWLQLQDADVRYHQNKDLNIRQSDFHERGIDRAHKRFLSAVKTLATVRRLAVPVLIGQVNIAAKQVNKISTIQS